MAIITVDGNIGSGKSTVLRHLHNKFGVPVDLEPVERWAPYLRDLYAGSANTSSSAAFEFQVRVWLDRCWVQHRAATPLFMERSPYFQALVFVATNYALGKFTDREHELLQHLYRHVLGIWSPALYVYLRSSPQQCCARIRRRNRESEDHIHPSYIALLHAKHEEAYFSAVRSGLRVVVIDVEDKNPDQIADEVVRAVFGA